MLPLVRGLTATCFRSGTLESGLKEVPAECQA